MSNFYKKSRRSLEKYRRSDSKNDQSVENKSDEIRSPVRSRSPLVRHHRKMSFKPSNDRIHLNHHPNNILAIFGLDLDARKVDLYKIYDDYGCVRCKLIMNRKTGRSRGFGFVYFKTTKEAIDAKYATENKKIMNKKIRIDYSMETGPQLYDHKREFRQRFYYRSSPIMHDRYKRGERSEPRQRL